MTDGIVSQNFLLKEIFLKMRSKLAWLLAQITKPMTDLEVESFFL